MKRHAILFGPVLLALSACANTVAIRSDCESMLPTERERCLHANESNRKYVEERNKKKKASQGTATSFEDYKKNQEAEGAVP